eukprot:COSAG02_NODE_1131_length_14392_cov_8.946061_6_plen_104_part_00
MYVPAVDPTGSIRSDSKMESILHAYLSIDLGYSTSTACTTETWVETIDVSISQRSVELRRPRPASNLELSRLVHLLARIGRQFSFLGCYKGLGVSWHVCRKPS